jgi:peptidoglycan/xylan/chitin deacetylase (PgdA/CDA1 family)
MIGVVARSIDHAVISEFFELFKTPWEIYRSDREYEVVLDAGDEIATRYNAKLMVVYGGRELSCDPGVKEHSAGRSHRSRTLSYKGMEVPIYGENISFSHQQDGFLRDVKSQETVGFTDESSGRIWARLGYDLFQEVKMLLTVGQPSCNAACPALEIHICILRDLIIGSGAELVEIPPVPEGYRFIACLTHDVDHPSIRQHKLDHTIFGFLYRAVFGSMFSVLKGRATVRQMLTNWLAVLKLPFVYIGIAKDLWLQFDRYPTLESGAHSSFFVIPFKDDPGMIAGGPAPGRRAARYGAVDISEQIRGLKSSGCEIGLHGINAWIDATKAREELEEIRRVTGAEQVGARMHWLYFNEESPRILERAGVDYDSTIGYNETIGFRAGTSQVYKPLGVARLLELPLHIMDTALFYPAHMNLTPKEARRQIGRIIDSAVRFGGVVTVNWHDRSIASERGWGDFYVDLVLELKSRGAWLAAAGETVSWFRKRRAAAFDTVDSGSVIEASDDSGEALPGLQLQVENFGSPAR